MNSLVYKILRGKVSYRNLFLYYDDIINNGYLYRTSIRL